MIAGAGNKPAKRQCLKSYSIILVRSADGIKPCGWKLKADIIDDHTRLGEERPLVGTKLSLAPHDGCP
jgi:hypothetical protein